MIRSWRRFPSVKRYFSTSDNLLGGVNVDDPDEIEKMENNYNEMYLQLHQSNVSTSYKMQDLAQHKEYRTIGEYAETLQESLSHHITSNQSQDSEPRPDKNYAATAVGKIVLGKENMESILEEEDQGKSLMTVAEVAGIMAAKKSSGLIPHSYCSQVQKVYIAVTLSQENFEVLVTSTVRGAEGDTSTEAVLACSIALVTIFDHFKTINNQQLRIGNISLQR